MMDLLAKVLIVGALAMATTQCGVKGDPLPPLQPHVTDNALDRFGDTSESTAEAEKDSDNKERKK